MRRRRPMADLDYIAGQVDEINRRTERIEKIMLGNGQAGLITRVASLETEVRSHLDDTKTTTGMKVAIAAAVVGSLGSLLVAAIQYAK